MSSSGEMKMSLKLMTCSNQRVPLHLCDPTTYVLMSQVFEELQLSIRAL